MPEKTSCQNHYTPCNRVRLIHGGRQYFALLEQLINDAQHSIFLHCYVFNEDETGLAIGNALKQAALRKVQVYLLVDGYASQHLSKGFVNSLQAAGVQLHFFQPLFKSQHFYFGRRMHSKVAVIDAQHALVGGINIANRYNNFNDHPAWLDMALLTEGETAYALFATCARFWKENTQLRLPSIPPKETILAAIPAYECCSVRIRQNDWVKGKNEIWNTYFNLFNKAQKSLTIMCSYFLPGRVLRKRLKLAAQRGVQVKVIMAGTSDVALAKYAERYLYRWMLRNHIEVYEYKPSVLHAKITVADEHWLTIGSFNVNNISTYASIELNLDVRNRPFAQSVQRELDTIIAHDCVQITERSFETLDHFFKRLLQKAAYNFVRLILNLSTFYFKQE